MTTTRCCSFCRLPGHNITFCTDTRIEETWKYVLREVDIRLGNDLDEEALIDAEELLQTLPRNYLRVLGVKYANMRVSATDSLHVAAIKTRIQAEATWFCLLRFDERIEYLNWLDPDSYDFHEEDPTDITHFAFFDRIPNASEISELEEDIRMLEELEKPTKPTIEPMMLCLETASELATQIECAICYESQSLLMFDKTNCGHSFCHSCICHHLDTSKNGPSCPNCRQIISTLEVKDADNYDDIVKRYGKPEELVSEWIPAEEETDPDWFTPSGLSIYL
jgi:hypothetical protein